jgi:hypothetical protein
MKEEVKEMVLQIRENLEKVNEGIPPMEYNFDKTQSCSWVGSDKKHHQIVILPTKDYSGVGVCIYTENLLTARVGLSTEAVVHLIDGLDAVVIKDREFLKALKEKNNEQVL